MHSGSCSQTAIMNVASKKERNVDMVSSVDNPSFSESSGKGKCTYLEVNDASTMEGYSGSFDSEAKESREAAGLGQDDPVHTVRRKYSSGAFTCCVPGCFSNSKRNKELKFYSFPK